MIFVKSLLVIWALSLARLGWPFKHFISLEYQRTCFDGFIDFNFRIFLVLTNFLVLLCCYSLAHVHCCNEFLINKLPDFPYLLYFNCEVVESYQTFNFIQFDYNNCILNDYRITFICSYKKKTQSCCHANNHIIDDVTASQNEIDRARERERKWQTELIEQLNRLNYSDTVMIFL